MCTGDDGNTIIFSAQRPLAASTSDAAAKETSCSIICRYARLQKKLGALVFYSSLTFPPLFGGVYDSLPHNLQIMEWHES